MVDRATLLAMGSGSKITRRWWFIRFLLPGVITNEEHWEPVDTGRWDDRYAAVKIAKEHDWGAIKPYAYQYAEWGRGDEDIASRELRRTGLRWLGGTIMTLVQVQAEDPDSVLAWNMRTNGWDRVVVNRNSYEWCQPLHEGDKVIPFYGFD